MANNIVLIRFYFYNLHYHSKVGVSNLFLNVFESFMLTKAQMKQLNCNNIPQYYIPLFYLNRF